MFPVHKQNLLWLLLLAINPLVSVSDHAQAAIGDSRVATWLHDAKGAYSISTDDDRPTQVYTIAPSLTERGLHGTFYVNPSPNMFGWTAFIDVPDVNGDGLRDGYAHLPEQGHELGSHTKEHWAVTVGDPDPSAPSAVFASYEDLAADCVEVNDYLERLTGEKVVTFAYPWGRRDDASKDVLRQYYLSARTTAGGAIDHGHVTPNPPSPPDMMNLRSYYTESGYFKIYDSAMLRYNIFLNDVISTGGWGIEYFHQTGNGWTAEYGYYGNWGTVNKQAYYEHLDNIVESVDAGAIWEDTVGNVSRYIYSRDAATIEYGDVSEEVITLKIDDMLDDELFSVPLTVVTQLPDSWVTPVHVTHNGLPVGFMTVVDPVSGLKYAKYDVVADGGPIVLFPQLIGLRNGDFNSDGLINEDDFLRWRSDYGMTVETPGTGADGNFDGIVDGADYTVWRDFYSCPACVAARAGAGAIVPEPTTLALLLATSAAIFWRRVW